MTGNAIAVSKTNICESPSSFNENLLPRFPIQAVEKASCPGDLTNAMAAIEIASVAIELSKAQLRTVLSFFRKKAIRPESSGTKKINKTTILVKSQ